MLRRTLSLLLVLVLTIVFLPGAAPAESDNAPVYGGKVFSPESDYINLGKTIVTDLDVFEAFLDRMPNLKQVDMWETRMTKDMCDRLAARYPAMKWGWTMVIKVKDHEHVIRTDYTSFSTLHNNSTPQHTSEDFTILKYCWNLLALDVGHNAVTNLDFLYDLPNLRVLIVACCNVTDITPIASLKHLEYLEIFKNKITDISPLVNLPYLLDLNICFNNIQDYTPLTTLPTLKRLWMYSSQSYGVEPPADAVAMVKEALKDSGTHIDTTHYSTTAGWREDDHKKKHPHYQAILDMFGDSMIRPKNQFVAFEDSLQDPPVIEENRPEAEEDPDKPADFSDRDYLLPIDFNPGSMPNPEGYAKTYDDEGSLVQTYTDSTIRVTVRTGLFEANRYWYADIQLTDASQLRTMAVSADGSFGKVGERDAIQFARRAQSVIMINGDFFGSSERKGRGFILRQGILYRNSLDAAGDSGARFMDVLMIDEDGDFHVFYQPTSDTLASVINGKRVLNSFSFGPILVDKGEVVTDYNGADRWINMATTEHRQRMCICQMGPLHYMVLCCAGQYHEYTGYTLDQFSRLAQSLGAQTAYNLDGGDSSWMIFNGEKVNAVSGANGRKLMDIIYFASGEQR